MKKWKNLVMAVVMGLAIGAQCVVPVRAAVTLPDSTNEWLCGNCLTPVSVSEVKKMKEITNIRTCTYKDHQSVGCKIVDIVYVVETWISCSGCPRSEKQSEREVVERNIHRSYN